MFFLFGLGKQTVKKLGRIGEQTCENCHKPVQCILVKVADWFTFFFIPIFPYLTRYALICPLCDHAREVSRDEISDMIKDLQPLDPSDPAQSGDFDGDPSNWGLSGDPEKKGLKQGTGLDRYEGKNPTQIAYLTKLEAREKEIAALAEAETREKTREAAMAQEVEGKPAMREAMETQDTQANQERHIMKAGLGSAENPDTGGNAALEAPEEAPAHHWIALDAREKAVEAREKAVEAREKAIEAREKAAEAREKAVEAWEKAAKAWEKAMGPSASRHK